MSWFAAFLLTCACEIPIVAAVAPRGQRRRAAVDALAANLLTHPLAWYAYAAEWLSWGAVETLVVVVEAAVYALVTRLSWPRAALASLLANGVTMALSFL
ncbi:MAG: hypothetical protein U1E73_04565 [Planctomycetota bacterium]